MSPSAVSAETTTRLARGPAVIVFENVSLAFDEKVILADVSFELLPGRMKIILGASGAGKSTILRLILGFLKPDAGRILVNGARVDELSEAELMQVRSELGMVFQEGALFDSLTVRENVGYKLYEESDMPIADADRRVAEVLGFVGMLVHGIGANTFIIVRIMEPFWLYAALIAKVVYLKQQRAGKEPRDIRQVEVVNVALHEIQN